MIYDKISNIDLYRGLYEGIYKGLKYLEGIDSIVENGVHQITNNVKAIVSEYETKQVNPNGFEAHREYLDIQYLISGEEIIKCKPNEGLTLTKEYDFENDYLLMSDDVDAPSNFLLGNRCFTLFYLDKAHELQLFD